MQGEPFADAAAPRSTSCWDPATWPDTWHRTQTALTARSAGGAISCRDRPTFGGGLFIHGPAARVGQIPQD